MEVNHILLDFPEGLHWKKVCEIGNKSYTENKWNMNRLIGDYSFNMNFNSSIYLSERGTYKLLKYCPEINNRDKIIDFFINYLKKNNKTQMGMEIIYKDAIKEKEFNNLNFYDARAIIKIFGGEKGIFHGGRSGTNTISLKKNIKSISLKEKIKDIIDNSIGEINRNDFIKKLQKTNEDLPLEIHLNDLVDEMKIFKISPGTYLNFKESIKLCIPIVAILDSNSDPEGIEFPIPGNDDARRSIDLYCSLIKETIQNAKKAAPAKGVSFNFSGKFPSVFRYKLNFKPSGSLPRTRHCTTALPSSCAIATNPLSKFSICFCANVFNERTNMEIYIQLLI